MSTLPFLALSASPPVLERKLLRMLAPVALVRVMSLVALAVAAPVVEKFRFCRVTVPAVEVSLAGLATS